MCCSKATAHYILTTHTPHYENVPFEVPSSWVWTTVNDISKSILYGVSKSAKSEGKYRSEERRVGKECRL